MSYSVELYFNECGENKLKELWKELYDLGISRFMHESGSRPHIALAVFDEEECDLKILKKSFKSTFTNTHEIDLIFSSIGIFPSEEGVTYVGIKPTIDLLEIHATYMNNIKNLSIVAQLWEYYTPEYWVPHCTMTIETTAEEQLMAIDVLRKRFRNFQVTVKSVALVKFYPYKVIDEIKLKENEYKLTIK